MEPQTKLKLVKVGLVVASLGCFGVLLFLPQNSLRENALFVGGLLVLTLVWGAVEYTEL